MGGLNLVEELAELDDAVAGITFANDLARRNVERREERGRAVARLVVAAPRGLTGGHGQHGLTAVERLDLGLLVHTQDNDTLGRGDVEHLASGAGASLARRSRCFRSGQSGHGW